VCKTRDSNRPAVVVVSAVGQLKKAKFAANWRAFISRRGAPFFSSTGSHLFTLRLTFKAHSGPNRGVAWCPAVVNRFSGTSRRRASAFDGTSFAMPALIIRDSDAW
jgi:hypothetical protein